MHTESQVNHSLCVLEIGQDANQDGDYDFAWLDFAWVE